MKENNLFQSSVVEIQNYGRMGHCLILTDHFKTDHMAEGERERTAFNFQENSFNNYHAVGVLAEEQI